MMIGFYSRCSTRYDPRSGVRVTSNEQEQRSILSTIPKREAYTQKKNRFFISIN